LWIRPTKVGECAHVLCRAGICADDFDACKAEIGAGCYAREARVIRNKKWSHLVTIDIIRHDPLTADVIIPSRIPRPAAPGDDVITPSRIIPPDAKAKVKVKVKEPVS
jgi:hypothetical protein